MLRQLAANRMVTVRQAEAAAGAPQLAIPALTPARGRTPLSDVTAELAIDFKHQENDFVDFDRERLIPKMLSTEGPPMAVGDVTGDGLDDMYLGGAKDQAGKLMLQQRD